MKLLLVVLALIMPVLGLSEEAAPAVAAAPPAIIDAATAWMLNSPGYVSIAAMFLSELFMRLMPTAKPLGWVQLASAFASKIGALLSAFAGFLDKYLVQNLKK